MDKLITNLDTNLGPVLREQLDSNFQKIQNGVDGQSDALNKQIATMLGGVPLQDKNEVTQARIDDNNVVYSTLKGRLDADQSTADTALKEERMTGIEVQSARSNSSGKSYDTLKARLDDEEANLTNNMNAKIAQISSVPETFANLSALQSAYPNGKTGLFVTADTGHKYIWANGSWADAGVYQSVGIAEQSINPSALSDVYDLQGDGNIHNSQYISGYGADNKIILWSDGNLKTLEIFRNKTGIIHLAKNKAITSGQAVLITDLQNNRIVFTGYDHRILTYTDVAIDYFVYVNETDVLINLDRISEVFGDNYKVWLSFPKTLTSIPLTNAQNNSFRNYLK